MTESLQLVLIIMLMVVIVFFIVLGVQVFFLLQDVRRTIKKANRVLDDTSDITESIAEPLSAFSGIVGTLGTGAILTNILKIAVRMISKTDSKKHRREDE